MDPWTPTQYALAWVALGVLIGAGGMYGWIYYGEVKKRQARYQKAKWNP